ncbi:MAG: hypothetical protein IJU12_09850, partial [Clostridia bacterium]|nr:hypothetical protein [Clostridia bacterium]
KIDVLQYVHVAGVVVHVESDIAQFQHVPLAPSVVSRKIIAKSGPRVKVFPPSMAERTRKRPIPCIFFPFPIK